MTNPRVAEDGEAIAADVAITDGHGSGRVAFTETIDASPLTGVKRHKDGYIAGRVKAARTGVQVYTGAEMGWPEKDVVAVYRPLDEVMRIDSLGSYKGKPITDGHPNERVTSDNWGMLARGTIMGVARDGDAVALDITVSAKDLVDKLESGEARELSAGYVAKIDRTSGVTPDGTAYDAVQRDIYIDHLAVVPRGRAGSEFRVGDDAANWGAAPIPPSKQKEDTMSDALKTVVLGDKAAQVAVADAQIIEQFKVDQAKKLADAETAHNAVVEAKDEEIGNLKADLKKAQDAAITPEKMTAMVADRVALETTVRAIDADINTANVSDADLRKAAVAKVLGDDMVKDASDAEITGMFKAVAKDAAKGDQFAAAVRDGIQSGADMTVADKAYADNISHLSNAWMGASKEA